MSSIYCKIFFIICITPDKLRIRKAAGTYGVSCAAAATAGCLFFEEGGYIILTEVIKMTDVKTKDILLKLRMEKGLSQDELAEKLYVTRQAVSRWENGETVPNTESLKLLSKLYDVSINTLLGSPRKLVCQCCGMPLDDISISREPDGAFNEAYCKWCYADGNFAYKELDDLISFLTAHFSSESFPPEQARAYYEAQLSKLDYWRAKEE